MLHRLRILWPRAGRLAVFLTVVGVALYAVLGRVVEAKIDGALIELGGGLATLAELRTDDGPRAFELNGTVLRLETAARDESVGEILDRAEAACVSDASGAAGLGRPLRGEDGGRGFVGCYTRLTPAEARSEIAVGVAGYRYVYAQASGGSSQEVRFWTEGSLDLAELFPTEGDAPGVDAPDLPRPRAARRLLSAREDGFPQQLTVYEDATRSAGELEAWYRAELSGGPWQAVATPEDGADVLLVQRADALAALVFSEAEAGGGMVTVLTAL